MGRQRRRCPAVCLPCKEEMDGPVVAAEGDNMTANIACKVPWVVGEPAFAAVAADARCCNTMGCIVANMSQQYGWGQPAYNLQTTCQWAKVKAALCERCIGRWQCFELLWGLQAAAGGSHRELKHLLDIALNV